MKQKCIVVNSDLKFWSVSQQLDVQFATPV